jgi:hypothetical protein
VLAPSESAQEFIEKIANVVLDKHLSKLLDKEEEALLDNLLFLFRDLDRYCGLSELEGAQEGDVLYSFGLLNTEGVQEPQRTYRLPKAQSAQMLKTKEALEKKLTKDANLNVCILLELLAEQIKK